MTEHLVVSASPRAAAASATVVRGGTDPVTLAEAVARVGGRVARVDVDGAAWEVGAAVSGVRMAGRDPRRVRFHVGPSTGSWAAATSDGRIATVLVSSTELPFPIVCAGVAFGGAVGLVAGSSGTVATAMRLATAFDRSPEHGDWAMEVDGTAVDPAPWGCVVTASRHLEVGTAGGAFPDGRVVVGMVEPAAGGGLLGLLRGGDALLQRAEVRPADRVFVRGTGTVEVDGMVYGHSTRRSSWVVEAGPSVSILPHDPM